MEKSKVYRIVRRMSIDEKNRFRSYIRYFGPKKHEDLLAIFNLLDEEAEKVALLDVPLLIDAIYPGQSITQSYLNTRFSALVRSMIEFLSQEQCELAREQLVSLKSQSETVIIDPDKAQCLVSARMHETFDSLTAVNAAPRIARARSHARWPRTTRAARPATAAMAHWVRLKLAR